MTKVSDRTPRSAGGLPTGERPPARSAPPGPGALYTVREGDTLRRIAQQELGDGARAPEIAAANPQLTDPDTLRAGDQLRLPVVEAEARVVEDRLERSTGVADPGEITGRSLRAADPDLRVRSKTDGVLNLLAGSAPARSAREQAQALHRAMQGGCTDEQAIYSVFEGASAKQRAAIEAAYQKLDPRGLRAALRAELSGLELRRVELLLDGKPAAADAAGLRTAMRGLGTDEDAIFRILEGKSNTHLDRVSEEYRQFDPGGLRAALADELSGEDLRRAESALTWAPALGSPAFEARLDEETGSVARAGNRVELLLDGVQSFPARNKLIDEATHSIHLQTFIFTDDETGWDLARRLAAKADQGVQVRVLYDAMGCGRSSDEMFAFLKAHGVEVRAYGDPVGQFWDLNDRWHEKHLIVDGQTSIEGGMNIANEYAYGGSGRLIFSRSKDGSEPWRDVDIRLEGPAVADAQRAFLRNWEALGPEVSAEDRAALVPEPAASDGPTTVRVVQHRPDEEGDQNTQQLYLNAIRSAQSKIVIENAYFVPPPAIRHELIAAARRGVDVQVLTNGRASSDMTVVSDAARYFYDEMLEAGVKIYERQGSTLHSKTAAFDDSYAIVGSVNLNGRSQGRDSEVAVAVRDPEVVRTLQRRFSSGRSEALRVTQRELDAEPTSANLKQWALSCLAWTF